MSGSKLTEFIYFRLKPSVKPEDPATSDEGKDFLSVLRSTKQQSGYVDSAWGRTKEDENDVVWAIDWSDARGASNASLLSPFVETEPRSIYCPLVPAISTSDTLAKYPVTELCPLAFPSSLSPDEQKKLSNDLIAFRSALCDKLPREKAPRAFSMGPVNRPGKVPHSTSPSGEAGVQYLVVLWESVEAHQAARETREFAEFIQPIREKLLPSGDGLQMRHVSFQKIE